MEANISLVLKKGKPLERCSSYRPVSVLNLSLKIIAKVLASRLEKFLPSIAVIDQSGFIKGRYSAHNIRHLLNLTQRSSVFSSDAMVISLDAEKVFDQLEWPYLLCTLQKFNFGEILIKWIQILFTYPLLAVIANGFRSKNLNIERGSRQGCHLSPR